MRDAEGKVQRWFGTNTDVTEQRKAAEALAQANDQIAAVSRAKDDFLATLSHELRTPLTPVLMTAGALENDAALTPDVREQLGMMRRNIELEARLIDDLLDLTRIGRGKLTLALEPTDVHQLIEHSADIVRRTCDEKRVLLRLDLNAARHHVLADATRLRQVFWNLLTNAVKFTPRGGIIHVKTENDHDDCFVATVSDSGIGIPAESLAQIFNAFEQGGVSGKHRHEGLGLGLAISQAIIAQHGGAISAASDGPGRGAAFKITLACVDKPENVTQTDKGDLARKRSLRLLLVDDHEQTLSVLSRLLQRRGHTLTTASSMKEALDIARTWDFDVLISDLGLPDGSGTELLREIRRMKPVSAIALSGYGMVDDVRETREAGFAIHLVKPVRIETLSDALNELSAGASPE